jgi:hypothetical protein
MEKQKTETKQAKPYVLTVLKDGVYVALTNEELANFAEKHPEIAKYWQNPETLNELVSQEMYNSANKPRYACWEDAAK